MTYVSGSWIKGEEAQTVCRLLTDAGYQAYFVGGCVRNDLLGAPISDLDLCTDALPDRVDEVISAAGIRTVPTGIEHGTVTAVMNHIPLEITTFRKDVATDGRRAVVAFSDRIEDDARRRDFTMNALYASADGKIHDPLGGLPDLDARKVRFIDDADARIKEDYLRTLRFFRFHAWYGDPSQGIDPDGLAACSANLAGLETLSKERLGVELLKLLSAPDPAPSVAAMDKSGVLTTILPGATSAILTVLVHVETDEPPSPIRRLAAVGGMEVAERLRLSKQDRKKLQLLSDHMGSAEPVHELAYRHGADLALDIVLLRAAVFGSPASPDAKEQIALGAAAQFPVKPADLMDRFQGRALGDQLKTLEANWIKSGFRMTREELLNA